MLALKPDMTYHIFNHANGFENIFKEDENYRFFMDKYQKYIGPIAETYAYCLLPNHFHLVVRFRKQEVIEELIRSSSSNFSNPLANGLEKLSKLTKQLKNFYTNNLLIYLAVMRNHTISYTIGWSLCF